jgi:hypothetical protein
MTFPSRRGGILMRSQSKRVLVFTRNLEPLGHILAGDNKSYSDEPYNQ